jgi:hypothetical protein
MRFRLLDQIQGLSSGFEVTRHEFWARHHPCLWLWIAHRGRPLGSICESYGDGRTVAVSIGGEHSDLGQDASLLNLCQWLFDHECVL